jgi:hypothetical protein
MYGIEQSLLENAVNPMSQDRPGSWKRRKAPTSGLSAAGET